MSAASPASPPRRCGPTQNPMTGTMMMCCACLTARTAPLWPQQALAATGRKVVLGCMTLLTGTDSHTPQGAQGVWGCIALDAVHTIQHGPGTVHQQAAAKKALKVTGVHCTTAHPLLAVKDSDSDSTCGAS